jgi:hypothetical protein
MTDDMSKGARGQALVVADCIGYANVEFRKGDLCWVSPQAQWTEFKGRSRPGAKAAAISRQPA